MAEKFKVTKMDGYTLYENEGGPTLGVAPGEGGVLIVDGLAFKDLNRDGKLDRYEDWRLPIDERVADLAARMSPEQIAGLMLYSSHQAICRVNPLAKYTGQDEEDTRENIWDLSGSQKAFLKNDDLRHVLVAMADSAVAAARWNNNAQAFAEKTGLGIPVSISSDPRHTPIATAEFDMGSGGDLSVWPDHLGLAATFDPEITRRFGEIASAEYRAMGITTALSPQVDLASDPRWWRFSGTFGAGVQLACDMARAYCDGFQSSPAEHALAKAAGAPGWGFRSVNAMVKHWPGGGSGEGGRDAHFGYGKYAVFPGNAQEEHLAPFIKGAFALEGDTACASAVMPYYTVSWNYDTVYGENVGNSYSKYIIADLLRGKYGYDGVVCTDWLITHDPGPVDFFFSGKCWGVESLSVAERHLKILLAGVDQFGGNNDRKPVLEALEIGAKEHGREFMLKLFRTSARRLLKNIFRAGLFENPYVDPAQTEKLAGCAEFCAAGFDAQVKSVVMLKNDGALPFKKRAKAYVPSRHLKASTNFLGFPLPERTVAPLDKALAEKYFDMVDKPEDADMAFCFIKSPEGKGYTKEEGYLPMSLQYRPYTATGARERNIAGDDDRSYKGKTGTVSNESDLDMVLDTKKTMGDKPVIVFVNAANPFVASEFEAVASAVLLGFAVTPEALLEIASGAREPSGLLPFQMPADMETVEKHCEDLGRDMIPYRDSVGNVWDFAFGLSWSGKIDDERTRKYR
ncbi:MAG: glycoside hydrolase family 3 C-terminal domain-containing protein [Treponema sp.]|nr:glycoside hydrolase family 3 C-terminal domain-containing protein [Treponema sp.]